MIRYKRRRFLPRARACRSSSRSRWSQGDRLDLITARTLGDPEQFWRVCDANDALDPAELTDEPAGACASPSRSRDGRCLGVHLTPPDRAHRRRARPRRT